MEPSGRVARLPGYMLSVGPTQRQQSEPASRADLDEVELVRRAQLGSAAAFEELVVRRGPQLYRFLAVRLGNESDARDALQETLTAAWQGLPVLKSAPKFWPWLVGIGARKAADTLRGRRGRRETPFELPEAPSDSLSPGDRVAAVDLEHALAALPPAFREVLLLRYVARLSEDEVASALGIRVGTVKSRSVRARKALGELLR
jgi:RNA polymerase sigma factor (sigma-70 family)